MRPGELTDLNGEAEALVRRAEQKIKGSFFKNLCTSREERLDAAQSLYKKAIDKYKLAKNCEVMRVRMRDDKLGVRQNFQGAEE
jgi:hypothetical protein